MGLNKIHRLHGLYVTHTIYTSLQANSLLQAGLIHLADYDSFVPHTVRKKQIPQKLSSNISIKNW